MFAGFFRNPIVWFFGLVIGLIAWALYFGLGWLPNRARYWILLPVAKLIYELFPGKKAQIKDNLRLIFPDYTAEEIDKAAWENVKTLLWAWSTILNMNGSHRTDIREHITGEEHLLKRVEEGKKVVVVFAHIGNINELTSAIAALGIQAFVPAQAIPFLLFKLMAGSRSRAGNIEFVAVRGGKTLEQCAQKLNEGKVVVVAMDMPPSKKGKGYFLKVGKAETEVQVGAIKLALEEQAEIIMAQIYWGNGEPLIDLIPFELTRVGGRFEMDFNSRELLDRYSDYLKANAEMWWRLPLIKMQKVSTLEELGYPTGSKKN